MALNAKAGHKGQRSNHRASHWDPLGKAPVKKGTGWLYRLEMPAFTPQLGEQRQLQTKRLCR